MKAFRSQSVRETLVWREKVHSATCQFLNGQSNGQTVNSGQMFKDWSNEEEFNCKYWYFWMSLQNWTIELKIGYLEN